MNPSNKQAHNKHRVHRNETVRPRTLNNINGDVDGEPLNKSRPKAPSEGGGPLFHGDPLNRDGRGPGRK